MQYTDVTKTAATDMLTVQHKCEPCTPGLAVGGEANAKNRPLNRYTCVSSLVNCLELFL